MLFFLGWNFKFQTPEDMDRDNKKLEADEEAEDAETSHNDTGPYFAPIVSLPEVIVCFLYFVVPNCDIWNAYFIYIYISYIYICKIIFTTPKICNIIFWIAEIYSECYRGREREDNFWWTGKTLPLGGWWVERTGSWKYEDIKA